MLDVAGKHGRVGKDDLWGGVKQTALTKWQGGKLELQYVTQRCALAAQDTYLLSHCSGVIAQPFCHLLLYFLVNDFTCNCCHLACQVFPKSSVVLVTAQTLAEDMGD